MRFVFVFFFSMSMLQAEEVDLTREIAETLSINLDEMDPNLAYDCQAKPGEYSEQCSGVMKDRVHQYFGKDFLNLFTSDTPWKECSHQNLIRTSSRKPKGSDRLINVDDVVSEEMDFAVGRSFETYNGACLKDKNVFGVKLSSGSRKILAQALKGEYTYQSIRLKKSQKNSIESLAGIDAVLGGQILNDYECKNFQYPAVSRQCDQLKKCQNPDAAKESMDQMVNDTVKALAVIKAKEEEMRNAKDFITPSKNTNPRVKGRENRKRAAAFRKKKQAEIDSIRKLYTWMDGKKFKSFEKKISKAKNGENLKKLVGQAVSSQLKDTRKKLKEKLAKEEKATNCLRNREADCDDYEDTVSALPSLDDNELAGNNVLDRAQCLENRINLREKKKDQIIEAGTMTALTIASLAAAPLTGGLSLAANGALTVGRVAILATQAAVVGADITYAAVSVNNAVNECQNQLEKVTQYESQYGKENQYCPIASNPAKNQLTSDLKSCLVSAAWASADAIPLLALTRLGKPFREAITDLRKGNPTRKYKVKKEVDNVTQGRSVASFSDMPKGSHPLKSKKVIDGIGDDYAKLIDDSLDHPTSTLLRGVSNSSDLAKRQRQLIEEAIETGMLYGKKLPPKELESLKHQKDLLDAVLENPEMMKKLREEGFDFDGFIRGTADSDMGKLEVYRKLLTDASPKSDLMFDFLKGKGPAKATEALGEVLEDMGFEKGQFLFNSKLDNADIRDTFGKLPVLTGYLHELPGMSDAVMAYSKGLIGKEQFKAQLRANLFHNGPSDGFWNLLEGTFIPGAAKGGGHQATMADLFSGGVFDVSKGKGSTVRPNYGAPSSFESFVGTFYDRMSQGTKGGYLKINEELSFMPPLDNVRNLVVQENATWTLQQLNRLKAMAGDAKSLRPHEQRRVREMIDTGMDRIKAQQSRMEGLIKFPVDDAGKVIKPPQAMEITHKVRKRQGRNYRYESHKETFEVSKVDDKGAPLEYKRVLYNKSGEVKSSETLSPQDAWGRIKKSTKEVLDREEAYHGNPMTELKP